MKSVLLPSVLGAILGILLLLLTILVTILVCLRCCPFMINFRAFNQKEQREPEASEESLYYRDARLPRPQRLHWYPERSSLVNMSPAPEHVLPLRKSSTPLEQTRVPEFGDAWQHIPNIVSKP